MPILYSDNDDGTLYSEKEVLEDWSLLEIEERFQKIEVPEIMTFTAEQVCHNYNRITELILNHGGAKVIRS